MSIAELNSALATVPTGSREKGTPVNPRNPNSPIRQESLWILDSGLDNSQPIEQHIIKLVWYIESKSSVLQTLLSSCEIDLFCGYSSGSSQGGFTLEADIISRLSIIPIPIILRVPSCPLAGQS
ncbi:MAG: DUF4279 domain-containing protein [Acidobacteria bacterium]|nr:DUF4279 domain-containing protein [Acidobacteriota bacterium]